MDCGHKHIYIYCGHTHIYIYCGHTHIHIYCGHTHIYIYCGHTYIHGIVDTHIQVHILWTHTYVHILRTHIYIYSDRTLQQSHWRNTGTCYWSVRLSVCRYTPLYKQLLAVTDLPEQACSRLNILPGPTLTEIVLLKDCLHCNLLLLLFSSSTTLSQLPRRLRRRSAAARCLGLGGRIPKVKVPESGWSLVQKNATEGDVSNEDELEAP